MIECRHSLRMFSINIFSLIFKTVKQVYLLNVSLSNFSRIFVFMIVGYEFREIFYKFYLTDSNSYYDIPFSINTFIRVDAIYVLLYIKRPRIKYFPCFKNWWLPCYLFDILKVDSSHLFEHIAFQYRFLQACKPCIIIYR
jgi:hypothetical protein